MQTSHSKSPPILLMAAVMWFTTTQSCAEPEIFRDEAGRIVSTVQDDGVRSDYEYDETGRLRLEIRSDGTIIRYDEQGNVIPDPSDSPAQSTSTPPTDDN